LQNWEANTGEEIGFQAQSIHQYPSPIPCSLRTVSSVSQELLDLGHLSRSQFLGHETKPP
jgi:hypothetical protein